MLLKLGQIQVCIIQFSNEAAYVHETLYCKNSADTAKAALGMSRIRKLKAIVPPLSLQNDFATFVECVDQQKQNVQQSLEKLELLKRR